MSNQDYKNAALSALKGNWAPAVLAATIFYLITLAVIGPNECATFFWQDKALLCSGGTSILGVFLYYPLTVGLYGAYRLLLVNGESDVTANTFRTAFGNYFHNVWGYVLMEIKLLLWTHLLIIPGIIKSFAYAMTPYILAENPEMRAIDAIHRSQDMMRGHKFDLFYLVLSFLGWMLLCIPTLGIGLLWLIPYVQTSMASFYEDVKSQHDGAAAPEQQ